MSVKPTLLELMQQFCDGTRSVTLCSPVRLWVKGRMPKSAEWHPYDFIGEEELMLHGAFQADTGIVAVASCPELQLQGKDITHIRIPLERLIEDTTSFKADIDAFLESKEAGDLEEIAATAASIEREARFADMQEETPNEDFGTW